MIRRPFLSRRARDVRQACTTAAMVAAAALTAAAAVMAVDSGRHVGELSSGPLTVSDADRQADRRPGEPFVLSDGASRSLPADWLGVNGANIRTGRGKWSTDAFQAAVADLGPQSLRVFGGTTANYWNWRKGTFDVVPGLPPDLRAAAKRPGSISLETWARTVESSGGNAVVVLNMVTDTLESQLDMLRTLQELGVSIRKVELGNELYSNDDPVQKAFPTGADYGRTAARWLEAVKREFPQAQVALSAHCGSNGNERRLQWTALAVQAAPEADAIACHAYVGSGLPPGTVVDDAMEVAVVLERARRILPTFLVRTERDAPGKPIWMTEWNLYDRRTRVMGTWAQGLALATMATQFARSDAVQHSDVHGLIGSAQFGLLNGANNALDFGQAGDQAAQPEAATAPTGPLPPPEGGETTALAPSAAGVAVDMYFEALRDAVTTRALTAADMPVDIAAQAFISDSGSVKVLLVNGRSDEIRIDLADVAGAVPAPSRCAAAPPQASARSAAPIAEGVCAASASTITVPAYGMALVG